MHCITILENGGYQHYSVDRIPNECPFCGKTIEAKETTATSYIYSNCIDNEYTNYIESVFQCPSECCQRLFVARYRAKTSDNQRAAYAERDFILECVEPEQKQKRERSFAPNIQHVSPEFCSIWNEANWAFRQGMKKIAGPGFRKSLEFLIKDYLCSQEELDAEKIKNAFLGKCIADYVKNPDVRDCAARAAWLGNDETHYTRKWTDYDIDDLIKLIEVTVHWIRMEQLSGDYKSGMRKKESHG